MTGNNQTLSVLAFFPHSPNVNPVQNIAFSLVLKKKTEYMLNCAEQEKPAAIEDRAKEPEVNVSTPEFIDRLLREKGLR